jgi:hypothetical protein
MGAATREYFLATFRDVMQIIDDSGIDCLLIGSLATSSLLDDPWDPASDIDLFVHQEGAEAVLPRFVAAGYATHWRDPSWIVKVARPNVTVDLLFRAGDQQVALDEEHLERAVRTTFEDVPVSVACREDLAVIKALYDDSERNGQWYEALRLLEADGVDWEYVAARGLAYTSPRVASLLFYLVSLGVPVDSAALAAVTKSSLTDLGI